MGVGPNDQVTRVRLFFNWIASSIEFDEATMSVKVDGRKQNKTNWPCADALATGREVCKGYALLFSAFFYPTLVEPKGIDKNLACKDFGA